MGYSHYYEPSSKHITQEQWDKFLIRVKRLIKASPVALGNGVGEEGTAPIIKDNEILLNGIGDNAHKTFHLAFNNKEWDFTKTARQPYDVVVTAILILAQNDLGYSVRSDGYREEWQDGLDTVHELFGDKYTTYFLQTKEEVNEEFRQRQERNNG